MLLFGIFGVISAMVEFFEVIGIVITLQAAVVSGIIRLAKWICRTVRKVRALLLKAFRSVWPLIVRLYVLKEVFRILELYLVLVWLIGRRNEKTAQRTVDTPRHTGGEARDAGRDQDDIYTIFGKMYVRQNGAVSSDTGRS